MELREVIIVIRSFLPRDEKECQQIVRDATMSTVDVAFRSALTRELTLQLVVVLSAIMFVFVDVTPSYCLFSIPLTAVIVYLSVYLAHLMKAKTMNTDMSDIARTYMSSKLTGFWVAEAWTSCDVVQNGERFVRILCEEQASFLQLSSEFSRQLVGTAAVVGSNIDERAAWMRRIAVVPTWQRNGVASALIDQVLLFCNSKGYESVQLVTTECHKAARQLYNKKGFQLRQLYHKQILSNVVQILMYEFTYSFG